jgi:hypothetical protein
MVQKSASSQTSSREIEPRLLAFLHETVDTFVKWDLIRFFHDNPHVMDTAENIARYTGRDVVTVEAELVGLSEKDVLRIKEVSGRYIFQLSADAEIRELINDFLLACDDRQFRVQAINEVINGMRQEGY